MELLPEQGDEDSQERDDSADNLDRARPGPVDDPNRDGCRLRHNDREDHNAESLSGAVRTPQGAATPQPWGRSMSPVLPSGSTQIPEPPHRVVD